MSRLVSEDLSEITSDDQYPRARKVCCLLRWKQNWKCALLTALVCTCLVITIVHHQQQSNAADTQALEQNVGSGSGNGSHISAKNAYWMLIFCGIILYSLYLMECSYATDCIELCDRNTQSVGSVCETIERMKNAQPIVWWKATCYHYARRKLRTTRFRRGTYFVSTKVYQERVNSFTSGSTFDYAACGVKDISNNLIIGQECSRLVKFRFSKGFAFLNMAAAIEFEDQRSTFFRELRRYDDFMDIHEGLDFANCISFDEEILALNTSSSEKKPWFADPFYYWLCSCLLLSWPFRLVLAYNTTYVHYKITKLFGTNYSNFTDSTQQLALFQFYETRMRDQNQTRLNYSATDTPFWSNAITPDDEDADTEDHEAYNLQSGVIGHSASIADITAPTITSEGAASELVPTYSEALLLLDDHEMATASVIHAVADVVTSYGVADTYIYSSSAAALDANAIAASTKMTMPLRSPALTRMTHESGGNQCLGHDQDEDLDKFVGNGDNSGGHEPLRNPPSYQEAMNLPVIEAVNALSATPSTSTSESFNIDGSPYRPWNSFAQYDATRLPSPHCRTFLSIETSL